MPLAVSRHVRVVLARVGAPGEAALFRSALVVAASAAAATLVAVAVDLGRRRWRAPLVGALGRVVVAAARLARRYGRNGRHVIVAAAIVAAAAVLVAKALRTMPPLAVHAQIGDQLQTPRKPWRGKLSKMRLKPTLQ